MQGLLAQVDLVVEAVVEEISVKTALFENLDEICKPGAILATTTSSLPVIELAAVTSRPQDVVGLHFFNPAPVMRLVEVVRTVSTSPETLATAVDVTQRAGRHPVVCGDRAGFIVNALARAAAGTSAYGHPCSFESSRFSGNLHARYVTGDAPPSEREFAVPFWCVRKSSVQRRLGAVHVLAERGRCCGARMQGRGSSGDWCERRWGQVTGACAAAGCKAVPCTRVTASQARR